MNRFMKAIAALMLMTAVVFTAESMNAQTHNGHDYVDLGLPSGTLWATCNVGATTPEDYGNYFAWGETQPKTNYDWSTYKYANGGKLTKYCSNSDRGYNGFADKQTTLQAGDDPATANWGSGWQTPSKEQWEELEANTTSEWTTRNGVAGREFTSKKNGKTIFLPAAGNRWNDGLSDAGSDGNYWSSSLDTGSPSRAWYFRFRSYGTRVGYNNRGGGRSVRAVREK